MQTEKKLMSGVGIAKDTSTEGEVCARREKKDGESFKSVKQE